MIKKFKINPFTLNGIYFYPSHGLATLKRIDSRTFNGKPEKMLVFQINLSNMTIMIKESQLQDLGIRPLISKSKAQEISKRMNEINPINPDETWNRRYRRIMDKMKEPEIDSLLEVYLELKGIQKTKDLSFGERKMLSWVTDLLTAELSVVLSPEPDLVA